MGRKQIYFTEEEKTQAQRRSHKKYRMRIRKELQEYRDLKKQWLKESKKKGAKRGKKNA